MAGTRSLRVAALLSDAFGGFGGLAKFNRDLLRGLDACPLVERVFALPRLIPEPIDEPIPETVIYDRRAAHGKLAFAHRTLALAWHGVGINLVVCGHLHLLPFAWALARARGARLAVIIHGIDGWTPTRHASANRLAHTVDAFIGVSGYSARRFAEWAHLPMERSFVMPNCVDLDHFRPGPRDAALTARYGLQDLKVLLTVARLAPEERYKGVDEVIEAMPRLLARVPNLAYLIAGDGPDRARLAEKARALGVAAQVVFAGRISEAEKVAHYNLADAFVMPSDGEGFGIVYVEAAACGIPVVGGATGGAVEALLDGRLGGLADRRDPARLEHAILAALDSPARGVRNPLVETFSAAAFTLRVDEWCRRQAAGATMPERHSP